MQLVKVEEGWDIQQYVRPGTIAEKMDVSVDTVLDMAHKGELEAVKFRGQVRISLLSFLKYLVEHHLEIHPSGNNAGESYDSSTSDSSYN